MVVTAEQVRQHGMWSATSKVSNELKQQLQTSSPWSDEHFLDNSPEDERSTEPSELLRKAAGNVTSTLNQLIRLSVAIRQATSRSRAYKADKSYSSKNHKSFQAHLVTVVASQAALSDDRLTPVQIRLIESNLRRRNRFLYAQIDHNRGLPKRSLIEQSTNPRFIDHAVRPNSTLSWSVWLRDKMLELPRSALNIILESSWRPEIDSPTLVESSRSQQAVSIHTTTTNASAPGMDPIPHQAFAQSTGASTQISSISEKIIYPNPPNVEAGAMVFKCPCCCQALDRNHTGKKWK
jgi:hypothetical protein